MKSTWHQFFLNICAIPHGSGNEKELSDYILAFAAANVLKAVQDNVWNVIIYKTASVGREGEEPVILQSHLDMA